jgi:HAD superfamily hydrolase (TIGR01459 family)
MGSGIERLERVVELVDRYEGFLVDLWGVIHDGERLGQGVREVLLELAARGARVCFLSNTSRLGSDVIPQLVAFGIPRNAFLDVVSSGDVTRRALVDLRVELSKALAKPPEVVRALHLGSSSYVPWLESLGFSLVEDQDEGETDLVVATGMVSGDSELRALEMRLRPLAERRVPLVCTNPDKWIPSSRGLSRGPGVIAQTYRDLGGPTLMYGKPYAPIYRAALERLGCAPERVVAIGDMVETDIVGAASASLASVLVTTGVHASELGPCPDDDALYAVLAPYGVKPLAILGRFGQRESLPGRGST